MTYIFLQLLSFQGRSNVADCHSTPYSERDRVPSATRGRTHTVSNYSHIRRLNAKAGYLLLSQCNYKANEKSKFQKIKIKVGTPLMRKKIKHMEFFNGILVWTVLVCSSQIICLLVKVSRLDLTG